MSAAGYDSLTDKSAPGEFCDTDAMWAATREIAEGRRHAAAGAPEVGRIAEPNSGAHWHPLP